MELAGIPSCSARSVTDIPFIFWLSISRAFNARSINCIVSSNFCNVRSHRIRGWLMSMSYRFYAIPHIGILFRLSKYYNFILALSNLQCKAFATSSRSFGICYNSPIFFPYNFTETCSSQRKIRFLSFRGMEKGRQYSAPLHSHVFIL